MPGQVVTLITCQMLTELARRSLFSCFKMTFKFKIDDEIGDIIIPHDMSG